MLDIGRITSRTTSDGGLDECKEGAMCWDVGPNCCSNYCDTTDPDCPNPAHACVGLDDLPLGLGWLGLCRLPP